MRSKDVWLILAVVGLGYLLYRVAWPAVAQAVAQATAANSPVPRAALPQPPSVLPITTRPACPGGMTWDILSQCCGDDLGCVLKWDGRKGAYVPV